jgi:UDP-N-acetylmuramoylalanine--D-glutamate ligase
VELAGQKVLVVGLGASGAAAARLASARGASVVATDLTPQPPGAQAAAAAGAELHLGGHRPEDFAAAELVVLSPGVDSRLPEVAAARRAGAEVIGELELAFRFLEAPAVMITGTNGKSTVTTLVGRMLAAAGQRVFVGGNLGTPLAELVLGGPAVDWAVLEVSSFQTDTAVTLRPRVGVCLNISPDHLDRYSGLAEYADSKMRLFANQGPEDVAVLCLDDPEVASRREACPGRVWGYAAGGPVEPGGWLDEGGLMLSLPGGSVELSLAHSRLQGRFNRLNQLAAALAASAAGAGPQAIQSALEGFAGLPHRLQLAAEAEGVAWFDDSKGTNVGAVAAALEALERPVVLLLGGRDKEGRFAELKPQLEAWVKAAVCFGEAGPSVHRQVSPFVMSRVAPDLSAAVAQARALVRPGEAVLLSPGCASFDAYPGYAARGEHFQRLVSGGEGGAR